MTDHEYDVALSFAGENRAFVKRVAEILQLAGISVFYDDFETTDLWGKDLAVHFDEVYRKKARFVVPFISRYYAEKAWPQHEFKSALARAVVEREPFLLPVRFDDTELPGLRPTIHYLDASKLPAEKIARELLAKLGEADSGETPQPAVASGIPKPPPSDFNPYEEAETVIKTLGVRLITKSESLRQAGYAVHAREGAAVMTLRVMRDGRTLYGFDAWIGHEWGENTICF